MKTTSCFYFSFIRYLVCIKCIVVLVAASTGNPNSGVDEGLGVDRKLPSKPEDLKSGQDHWIDSRRTPSGVFRETDETSDEEITFFFKDKCSRYCIQEDANQKGNVQYINLLWTANDTGIMNRPRLSSQTEWTRTQGSNNIPRNCQIYLDLDCNVIEAATIANYANRESHSKEKNIERNEKNDPVQIAEKYNLSRQTQANFSIDPKIHRVVIDIYGNLSNVLLQIPTNATASRRGTTMSWVSKRDVNGVRIDARGAPSGEWRMKLAGQDRSEYHFATKGFVDEENDAGKLLITNTWLNGSTDDKGAANYRPKFQTENYVSRNKKETFDDKEMEINSELISIGPPNFNASVDSKIVENRKISRGKSLKYYQPNRDKNNRTEKENSTDNSLSVTTSSTKNRFNNIVEYVTFIEVDENGTTSSNSLDEKSVETFLPTKEPEEPHARSSIGEMENLDIDIGIPMEKRVNISMRMVEPLHNRELSEELVNYAKENTIEEKRTLIEVNKNSNLLVTPGTIHRVVFDVLNSCVLPVRYAFRVKSTPFRLYNIQPPYAWIYPGQISNVAIDLVVPDNVAPDTANTVSLSILGTEINEKSVYLYVQGSLSKLTDDVKPTIEYSFNNNCAGKLDKDRCYKSSWSVDITVQDYDSGLKRIISSVNNVYPHTEFISGTRSPVTFYYSATCCDKTVKITAIDLLDNYNTITIDVTAWNNLSEAEIAAITVGALLAFLFIVLVIILIIYCIRRRKSHDLPYTQRYGSRPPTQSERTNF